MPGNNEKIKTDLVESCGSMLATANDSMNGAIESLQKNINQFGWGWRGPTSEHAQNAFSEIKNDLNQKRSNSMRGYSEMLIKTVSPGYVTTETSNFGLAAKYKEMGS